MKTMDGEPVVYIYWKNCRHHKKALQLLEQASIKTYEADRRWPYTLLTEYGVQGVVSIDGDPVTPTSQGLNVSSLFRNCRFRGGNWDPQLRVLSIDIETECRHNGITAIALVCDDPWNARSTREVLLLGKDIPSEQWIRAFSSEEELLKAFARAVRRIDPDVITGWNVIGFDLRIIIQRARLLGVAMNIGRNEEPPVYLSPYTPKGGDYHWKLPEQCKISGRVALDAMRLAQYGGEQRYASYRLEDVARATLKRGKLLQFESGSVKMRQLENLHSRNPVAFARYCLYDAILVVDIIKATGLLDLTIQRCCLTGVPMANAWGSIASFDSMYLKELHCRGIVAPTTGVDRPPVRGSEGGGIIAPQSGLYYNVLVFDFKSLYPSLIISFNIDPLTLRDPPSRIGGDPKCWISAPNELYFDRSPAILPQLLRRFFEERAAAAKRKDSIASFVYKILMNSCYGVLGSSGCRFGDARLSSSITAFGRYILSWSAKWLQNEGYTVIYGDTDSLFALSGHSGDVPYNRLEQLGNSICARFNNAITEWIGKHYGVESKLELEFEKVYRRLLLPRTRSIHGPQRGRIKGYAGHRQTDRGATLEIVGMEAARRDWTDLSHDFQSELLQMVFEGADRNSLIEHSRKTITKLRAGELDSKLVYRKRIRKPLSAYTASRPPHVRAASELPVDRQQGIISYIITASGPHALECQDGAPDYDHYIQRQLQPIATAIGQTIGFDLDIGGIDQPQIWLSL